MSEYHCDSSLPQPEIEQIAQLFIIDSDTLGDEELEHWRGVGLRFINELSDESFRMRFGVPKPHEQDELLRYVDHFVTNTG